MKILPCKNQYYTFWLTVDKGRFLFFHSLKIKNPLEYFKTLTVVRGLNEAKWFAVC